MCYLWWAHGVAITSNPMVLAVSLCLITSGVASWSGVWHESPSWQCVGQ